MPAPRAFPRGVGAALASYFSGGGGPTHSAITTAALAAGIVEPNIGGNKEDRVNAAFAVATDRQRFDLADELVVSLASGGYFENSAYSQNGDRLRAALERIGASIDGWAISWRDESPSSSFVDTSVMTRNAADALVAFGRAGREALQVTQEAEVVGITGTNEIFLVHGRDTAARNEVEVFVTRATGISPIVLALEANEGRTLIEKFETHAARAGFAIVLMTGDDVGGVVGGHSSARARQNVVFEFGYFVGALGRRHVAALVPNQVERPSDIDGLVYIGFGSGTDWKEELRREFNAAGISTR